MKLEMLLNNSVSFIIFVEKSMMRIRFLLSVQNVVLNNFAHLSAIQFTFFSLKKKFIYI